jgi:hypothetical protein
MSQNVLHIEPHIILVIQSFILFHLVLDFDTQLILKTRWFNPNEMYKCYYIILVSSHSRQFTLIWDLIFVLFEKQESLVQMIEATRAIWYWLSCDSGQAILFWSLKSIWFDKTRLFTPNELNDEYYMVLVILLFAIIHLVWSLQLIWF